jgi:hypothetical protein
MQMESTQMGATSIERRACSHDGAGKECGKDAKAIPGNKPRPLGFWQRRRKSANDLVQRASFDPALDSPDLCIVEFGVKKQ